MRQGDAAFDLTCAETVILKSGRVTKVRTGLEIVHLDSEERRTDEFSLEPYHNPYARDTHEHQHKTETPDPSSIFLKIEGRGGKSSEGIFPVGGIIDSNYRGEIIGLMANLSGDDYTIKVGDRFAQLIFYKIVNKVDIIENYDSVDHHLKTNRGKAGFGSSDSL